MDADVEHERTKDELLELLDEQLDFLTLSCRAYDQGSIAEAKRIAAVVRTLVHHAPRRRGRGSHALLSQLDIRDSIQWLSTSERIVDVDLFDPKVGLAVLTVRNDRAAHALSMTYEPKGVELIEHARLVDFSEWWTETVVRVRDAADDRHHFSRDSLIRTIANKDGGTHVDPAVPMNYRRLTEGTTTSWSTGCDDCDAVEEFVPVRATEASVRQVAFEVFASLGFPMTAMRRGLWEPGNPFPYKELYDLPPDPG